MLLDSTSEPSLPHPAETALLAAGRRFERVQLQQSAGNQTLLLVADEPHDADLTTLSPLAQLPGVVRVIPTGAAYRLAELAVFPAGSVVRVGGCEFGGQTLGVIAGPCAVESREQILQAAMDVKAAGATALRGGAFKPRTSPYSFQGHKADGLVMLAEARAATGLPIVTEVMAPDQVTLVAETADCLQIGARNMQNYPLLEAAGRSHRPVLLKRGPSATIDEFLLAAEYLLANGQGQVILCERGIRTFESHTRFTLPLATVPYLKARTHLPVVVDPSHGTGDRSLVPAMAAAAIAAGADGLLVEVHPRPDQSVSDAAQTIDPATFAACLETCRRVAAAVGKLLPLPDAAPPASNGFLNCCAEPLCNSYRDPLKSPRLTS